MYHTYKFYYIDKRIGAREKVEVRYGRIVPDLLFACMRQFTILLKIAGVSNIGLCGANQFTIRKPAMNL